MRLPRIAARSEPQLLKYVPANSMLRSNLLFRFKREDERKQAERVQELDKEVNRIAEKSLSRYGDHTCAPSSDAS